MACFGPKNVAGTSLKRRWNVAGTSLERRWNVAGTSFFEKKSIFGAPSCFSVEFGGISVRDLFFVDFGPFLQVWVDCCWIFSDFGRIWLVQAFRISFCLLKGSLLNVASLLARFDPILDLGRIFDVGFELGGCPPGMLLRCFSLWESGIGSLKKTCSTAQ